MRDVIGITKDLLPEPLIDRTKGTAIERVYRSEKIASFRGRTARTEFVTFQTPAGTVRLRLPQSSGPFKQRFSPGGYEPVLAAALARELDRDSIYYDVGAGYGYNCVLAEEIGVNPNNIYVFEADAFRFPILKKNVDPSTNLMKTFVTHWSDRRCLSIDDFARSARSPEIVTIDVEGGEYDVLVGAKSVIVESLPTLYVELHPEMLPDGTTLTDIFEFLRSHNYRLAVADHRSTDSSWEPLENRALPLNDSTSSPTCMLRAKV